MSRVLVAYADKTGDPLVLGTCSVQNPDLPYVVFKKKIFPIRQLHIKDREIVCKVVQISNKDEVNNLARFIPVDNDQLLLRFLSKDDKFWWEKF